jgi:hypothetical protein
MSYPEERRSSPLPLIVALVAVLAIGAWIYWQAKPKGNPVIPAPTTVVSTIPKAVIEPLPAIESSTEQPLGNTPEPVTDPVVAEALPKLDQSDAPVIAKLLEISGGGFQQWIIDQHLIRKFVRAVNALEEGKLVSQYRPFSDPKTPFAVAQAGDVWHIKPDNYTRYTPYITSLELVGAVKLANLYRDYYPLLQQAYEELGVNKGTFHDVMLRALKRLESTPIPSPEFPLIRPSVAYVFAAPDMEQRSQVEKLLFRLGADNSQRLKVLCSALLVELK